jgi:thioredoxin 1
MVVETITAKDWEQKVSNSQTSVVVNFAAARCGFCKMLEPLYRRLSGQYKGRLQFLMLMADDPANREVMNRVSIQGTPTLKFYCKGREVGEHIGYAIEPTLKKKIDSFLQEMESCLANSTAIQEKNKSEEIK